MVFHCGNCGSRLTVPEGRAGKKGRCPKCKQTLIVPAPSAVEAEQAEQSAALANVQPDQASSLYDMNLLDVPKPEKIEAPVTEPDEEAEAVFERLRAMHGGRLPGEAEEIPERKLPWMIDILFYPMNRAGLSVLLISVGVPFVLRVLMRALLVSMIVIPVAFIFWVLFIIVHWLVLLLLILYVNWYVAECIRDSAAGGIRAADTIATTPGFGEIFAQAFRTVVCVLAVTAPALVYLARTHRTDDIFKLLYGIGGFFFPMALLAVVMFEGLHGLNPVLLIGSILKMHVRYLVLVPFCYLLCLLIPVAGYCLVKAWALSYLLLFAAFYQLLILAHLLGRFYWKNEERLNWDA
jgi:hypothetical protein